MINFQPTQGHRHCLCANVGDGFTQSLTTPGQFVHAACGKPRPRVETNIHELPPPVMARTEHRVLTTEEQEDAPALAALHQQVITDASDQGVELDDALATADAADQDEPPSPLLSMAAPAGENADVQAEQPKRRRGRPPKDTSPLALERRDAPDKWCVIHDQTGEIIASGITSKAKASARLDELLPIWRVHQNRAHPAGHTPQPSASPPVDHVPAEPGQPTGPAASDLRAAEAGDGPENSAAERDYGRDQSGDGSAVPRAGSDPVQPDADPTSAALPEVMAPGQPEAAGELRAVGAVQRGQDNLVPQETVTDDQRVRPALIHGPGGDCADCWARGDYCPASLGNQPLDNPAEAETSPDATGRGGVTPAAATSPGPQLTLPAEQLGHSDPGIVTMTPIEPSAPGIQTLPGNPMTSKDWEQVEAGTWEPILEAQARGEFPATPATDQAGTTRIPADKIAELYGQATLGEPFTGKYPENPTNKWEYNPAAAPGYVPVDSPGGAWFDRQPANNEELIEYQRAKRYEHWAREDAEAAAAGSPANEDPATWGAEPIQPPSPPVDNPGDNQPMQVPNYPGAWVPDPVSTAQAQRLPGVVIDSSRPSLAAFMGAAKHVSQSGNTPWAAQWANELREIVTWHANNDPRSLQRHLGPSEIGVPCDRQVVGKLAGFPRTNHVTDPWPSWMGRAGHKAMEDLFAAENGRIGWERWFTERRVEPHPDHAGTSDLYDAATYTVYDHKFLGQNSMAKLRGAEGPPIKYQFQLKLYARGYRRQLGYRVDRIAIIGWPRTSSSIDGMYVWEHVLTPADDVLLEQLFARMAWRQQFAEAIRQGQATLSDVPAVPDEDDCYFCEFYRPQSARDGGPGCPGHVGI